MEQKPMNFPKHGISEFLCYGKIMRKHKHSKVMDFLHISREAEIHTIAKSWDEWILILRNKYGKTQTISRGFSNLQI